MPCTGTCNLMLVITKLRLVDKKSICTLITSRTKQQAVPELRVRALVHLVGFEVNTQVIVDTVEHMLKKKHPFYWFLAWLILRP
jgi:hypothetical protein